MSTTWYVYNIWIQMTWTTLIEICLLGSFASFFMNHPAIIYPDFLSAFKGARLVQFNGFLCSFLLVTKGRRNTALGTPRAQQN